MTTTDEISALDHTYLLNEEQWTQAAQSPNSPEVTREIEEKYCEIAAKRLQQEVFDFGEVTA